MLDSVVGESPLVGQMLNLLEHFAIHSQLRGEVGHTEGLGEGLKFFFKNFFIN